MDDPNLMQNSTTSISPDKKDIMTSVSPPKRTIVLGVVNTTGMKSTNLNRKRRWDQPPEEISGPPTVKKLCMSESEAFVNETESLETASAVSPNVDRINSQCDNISDLSNQSTHAIVVENEEISIELPQSHSSDISSEASAMSIDLPEDNSDKCKPLCEPSSDIKACSDPNENLSEVNSLESCERLQCVETVTPPKNDSRFIANDITPNKDTSSVTVRETKTVKHDSKSNASAAVISHQSDELRRIMFSYDEGTSDSDTMESCLEDNADESISSSTKTDENVSNVRPSNTSPSSGNVRQTNLESSEDSCERVSFKDSVMSENDSHVSPVSSTSKPLSIQSEYKSNETDAFIESSKSLENLEESKGSQIESQHNIPNESEVVESTDSGIKCDSLPDEILNKNQENVVDSMNVSSSIYSAQSFGNSPQEVIPVEDLKHSGPDNQNLAENIPLYKEIKNDQHVEPTKNISANNDLQDKINLDQKSEVDAFKEPSNFDNSEEKTVHFNDEVSLKINNEEAVDETSEQFFECDNGQVELHNPSDYKSYLEPGTIQIKKQDINISDDEIKINSSIEGHVSPCADISVNENSIEIDDFVKSEETGSKVKVVSIERETGLLSSENNHKLVHSEELEKVSFASSMNESTNLAKHIKCNSSEVTVEDDLKNIIRPEDSPIVVKTSNEKSDLLKLQSFAKEVHLNDSNVLVGNVSQENYQSSKSNEQILKVTDKLMEEDIHISVNVKPSENIDPAVMEVILGPNEGTAIINDSSILNRTVESDLKSDLSQNPESASSYINLEEKMDIVGEESNSTQSVPEKNVRDNVLVSTADTIKNDVDRNIETSLESDMIIDDNSKLNVGDKDRGISPVKEVINPDNCNPIENVVEINKESNVIENYISVDHHPGTDAESEKTEHEIIEKDDSTVQEQSSTKITESKINSVEASDTDLKLDEINEPDLKTKEINDGLIEASNTEISSVDVDQVEPRSIENNDVEVSTEETIETEVSIEENVENELCPLESDEIVTVEANMNDIENVITSEGDKDLGSSSIENVKGNENCDNEFNIADNNDNNIVENDENVNIKSEEELAKTDSKTEAEINVGNTSPSRRTIDQELKELDDVSESTEIKNVSDSTQHIFKELVIQEEIGMDENSTVEEFVYDNTNIDVREDDIVLTSVDSPPYEDALNPSPEESKIFEKSIDVSETIGDEEMSIDSTVVIEPVEDETKTIGEEADSSKVEENILQDDTKTLAEDIEESFVIEEVVTCESPESNKDADNDFVSVNEDISSPLIVFEETCETTESFVNNEVNAVIKDNTVDSEASANDNQNEISNDSNLGIDNSVKKQVSISKDLINEPSVNNIRTDSPLLDMECESSVNSIIKTDSDLEMDIVETPSIEKSNIGLKLDSIKVDKPPASVLKIGDDLSSVAKDLGINVPLLTTVNNSAVLIKDKPTSSSGEDVNRSGSTTGVDPKLEPITLRIYKDNLSIRTEDLDSPKKSRSPKLSSELKSQLSPHIKSSDSKSSLSPTTKKLEFTLKIAKDVNTNIPRATMSPKSSVSPSSMHKPGEILRAELMSESGRSSPAYVSPESGTNKVKLKIQKPGLSMDYVSHITSGIKEEPSVKDGPVDHSSGISLPKPPIEIGNVFKKMMETEKNADLKPEINTDHTLNSPLMATPITTPVVRKRGRPRKILQQVLPGVNSNLIPGQSPGLPFNHTSGASPGLDGSSGVDSSDQSSRQVRSCRARTKPIVIKTRKPRGGGARGGMRGRGAISSGIGGIVRNLAAELDPEKLAAKLSEREKAELAKIEERKERQRQERHAKNEAKKAKKLARKLKDEERRLKKLREKAEKAEAAAPQVFEEETRMSAPDGGSRGHTPAPGSALSRLNQTSEHNEESQNSISTPTSSQIKRGRMEIPIDPECKEVRVEHLAEYQWQGSELFMIQEQVSLYLGVKSFKRKYPDLKRRPVEAEERTFLEDSGLVPKSMCDLGLTAVSSAEILDIMFQDFPDKYEEFRKYCREKQAREASFKQRAVFASLKQDKSKGEPREQALEAVAMWNSNLNRERREERRCALDLQTFTVHYPKQMRDRMSRPVPKTGLYPVSLIPGQFSDSYKTYTPTELMYFPLNTVMYGPLKPNERQPINPSDGSGSDSSSSSTSDDSSSSSSECESEDENGSTRECKICNGEKKTNKESHPEILLQCSNCKGLCHPTCQEITPEMLPHIKKYTWHCSNCKKCMMCKNTSKDDKMLFCDLCDRGYHIHCVGLKKAPEGRWHCSVCSFCTVCGSKDPGGPEWNYEYKKTDKGVRLYQRTLCVPCSKNALM